MIFILSEFIIEFEIFFSLFVCPFFIRCLKLFSNSHLIFVVCLWKTSFLVTSKAVFFSFREKKNKKVTLFNLLPSSRVSVIGRSYGDDFNCIFDSSPSRLFRYSNSFLNSFKVKRTQLLSKKELTGKTTID